MFKATAFGDVSKGEIGFGDQFPGAGQALFDEVIADGDSHFVEKPLLKSGSGDSGRSSDEIV